MAGTADVAHLSCDLEPGLGGSLDGWVLDELGSQNDWLLNVQGFVASSAK